MHKSTNPKSDKNRVRRLAAKHGCFVRKSRTRNIHIDDFGEYALIDTRSNFVIIGARFDASLHDIETHLTG